MRLNDAFREPVCSRRGRDAATDAFKAGPDVARVVVCRPRLVRPVLAGTAWFFGEHCMAILAAEQAVIAARGVAATLTEDALERDRAPPPAAG
ncbi:hypothetical protein GCM10009610_69610 [Pseudonocardia xinjiangensis]